MLVFYCARPRLTQLPRGAGRARELGSDNVYVMPDGIAGWEKAKQPIEVG